MILLTTKQVASELGVELQTVYRIIKSGSLKTIRLSSSKNSQYRIDKQDLESFLAERKRGN